MSNKRFTEEFKIEAVKQITERRHPISEVSARLGDSIHSLYAWIKQYSQPGSAPALSAHLSGVRISRQASQLEYAADCCLLANTD